MGSTVVGKGNRILKKHQKVSLMEMSMMGRWFCALKAFMGIFDVDHRFFTSKRPDPFDALYIKEA